MSYNPVNLTIGLGIYGILTGIIGLIVGYDTRTYKLSDIEALEEEKR